MTERDELLSELQKDFTIQVPEIVSRETILQQLEIVISRLLEQNAETFFQLMYRLDIPEDSLVNTLENKENTVSGLAELILERQLQKIRSRRNFTSKKKDEDEELSW